MCREGSRLHCTTNFPDEVEHLQPVAYVIANIQIAIRIDSERVGLGELAGPDALRADRSRQRGKRRGGNKGGNHGRSGPLGRWDGGWSRRGRPHKDRHQSHARHQEDKRDDYCDPDTAGTPGRRRLCRQVDGFSEGRFSRREAGQAGACTGLDLVHGLQGLFQADRDVLAQQHDRFALLVTGQQGANLRKKRLIQPDREQRPQVGPGATRPARSLSCGRKGR